MLVSISWKNIWRSKLRSLVIIAAIIVGLWGGIFCIAFMYGMGEQRIDSLLKYETSHIQIHHPDFKKNKESKYFLSNSEELISKIKDIDETAKFSKRHKVTAMASTSRGNAGVMINAINPADEKSVSLLSERIQDKGEYLSEKRNRIFIGAELAYKLKLVNYKFDKDKLLKNEIPDYLVDKLLAVKLKRGISKGDFEDILKKNISENEYKKFGVKIENASRKFKLRYKIKLVFQDKSGALAYAGFRVCGVYKTTNTAFDLQNVFVNKKDFVRQSGYSKNDVHELVVKLSNTENIKNVTDRIGKTDNYIAEAWYDLKPDMKMLTEYLDFFLLIFIGIIIFALAFGILNTMLMAILERTKEIGMLMAIGMGRLKVFLLIMLETLFLSMLGSVFGMLLAFISVEALSNTGIHLSMVSKGLEAIGYSPVVYPVINPVYYLYVALMVSVTAILSSIYPAIKALRLKPAEAIRME